MKKVLTILTICIILFIMGITVCVNKTYAVTATNTTSESNLVQIKEEQLKTLEDYQNKYGSDAYGLTAYILHIVQIYSIPFCFLGIVISIIYKVVIGARHLENAEKGLGMIVAIVTLTIICQVLPLVFAVVVKLGRE